MDISSNYLNMVTSQASNVTSNQRTEQIKNKDYSQSSDEELLQACKEFETYYLEQVMKKMMDTVSTEDDPVMNNQLVSYFMDSTVSELCAQATDQQSLGLAQMLYEQMKRNYGTELPLEEAQQTIDTN